jgi:hypothetical protein
MIKSNALTEEDKELMNQYNITSETRTLFFSEGYKYDKLKDALSYAKLAGEREKVADNE